MTLRGTPIDDFSRSHDGILAHLNRLGELPALIAPARRARQIARDLLAFFDTTILAHHREEEDTLFPAVLRNAASGPELDWAHIMTERLTREHRQIEAWWARLQPQLIRVAAGQDTPFDDGVLERLIDEYRAHARYEEAEFLPLSQTILGRDGARMAALARALHERHAGQGQEPG